MKLKYYRIYELFKIPAGETAMFNPALDGLNDSENWFNSIEDAEEIVKDIKEERSYIILPVYSSPRTISKK